MKIINFGHIKLEIDIESTIKFYTKEKVFTCNCQDCLNYVKNIPKVKALLNGLDIEMGIDLHKDVGQGMDEIMTHDFLTSQLVVIPYYTIGNCYIDDKELEKEQSGPIWPNTKRAEIKLSSEITLVIINTSNEIQIDEATNILTIWIEFKTNS